MISAVYFVFFGRTKMICFYKEIKFVYQVWSLQSWWKGKPEVMDHRDKMEGILGTVWLFFSYMEWGKIPWTKLLICTESTETKNWKNRLNDHLDTKKHRGQVWFEHNSWTYDRNGFRQSFTPSNYFPCSETWRSSKVFFSFSFYNKLQIFFTFFNYNESHYLYKI